MRRDLLTQIKQDLSKLRELLGLSDEKFRQVDPTEFSDDTKRTLLYVFWGAIHKYSESVYQLCLKEQFEAASVIVRSIYEGSVYMSYILLDETNERALEFWNEPLFRSKRFIDAINKFNSKYPEHTGYLNSPEAKKKLLEADQELGKQIKLNEKQYGKLRRHLPNLINASRQVDEDKEQREIDSSHNAEYTYLSIYSRLSHYAHLSPNGLDYFIGEGPDGLKFIAGPNYTDAPALILQTYWTLQNLLGETSKYFDTPEKKELKPFNDYFKKTEDKLLKQVSNLSKH